MTLHATAGAAGELRTTAWQLRTLLQLARRGLTPVDLVAELERLTGELDDRIAELDERTAEPSPDGADPSCAEVAQVAIVAPTGDRLPAWWPGVAPDVVLALELPGGAP